MNKPKLERHEYVMLKKNMKECIRISNVSTRFKKLRNLANLFYYRHCEEISPLGFYRLRALLTQLIWGERYSKRISALRIFMKALRTEYFEVIEFEEVA